VSGEMPIASAGMCKGAVAETKALTVDVVPEWPPRCDSHMSPMHADT